MITDPDQIRAKFNSTAALLAFDRIENALHPRWDFVETSEGVHLRPCVRIFEIDSQQPFHPIEPTRHHWIAPTIDEAMVGHEKAIRDEGGVKGAIITAFGLGAAVPDRSFTYDAKADAYTPISQDEVAQRIFRRVHPSPA